MFKIQNIHIRHALTASAEQFEPAGGIFPGGATVTLQGDARNRFESDVIPGNSCEDPRNV